MRKRICLQSLPFTCSLFILLAGLMTIVGCAPTTAVPPDRVISENRWDESIVRIFGIGMMNLQGQYTGKQYPKAFPELSHGTGIILTKNGLIVTNRHVVENREGLVVKINNSDRSLPAKIVYVDRKYDLAFILIKVDDLGFFPFKEKNINANIQRGDVVNVLGFPIDPNQRQASYTSGVVSRTVTLDGKRYFQISAPVNPGNSGGPVLDNSNRLVGMVMAGAKRAENYNIIIPVVQIRTRYIDIVRFRDVEDVRAQMHGKEWNDYKEYSLLAAAMIEKHPGARNDLAAIILKGDSEYLPEAYVLAAGILWNKVVKDLNSGNMTKTSVKNLALTIKTVESAIALKGELRTNAFIKLVRTIHDLVTKQAK